MKSTSVTYESPFSMSSPIQEMLLAKMSTIPEKQLVIDLLDNNGDDEYDDDHDK